MKKPKFKIGDKICYNINKAHMIGTDFKEAANMYWIIEGIVGEKYKINAPHLECSYYGRITIVDILCCLWDSAEGIFSRL